MPFDGLESPFVDLAKLDHVIELIRAPGRWTKCVYTNPRGQYCLKEALNIAGAAQLFEPMILRAAAEVTDREFCCIESFNDWPETAHADVVEVLRRVRSEIMDGRCRLPLSKPYPVPSKKDAGRARSFRIMAWLFG